MATNHPVETSSSATIVYRFVPSQEHLNDRIHEAVAMVARTNPALRNGDTGYFTMVTTWARAMVQYGVEFLRTGNNGMAVYHYMAELERVGLGLLAWACGCLATALAAAVQGNVAQRKCSGQALAAAGYGTRAVYALQVAVAAHMAVGKALARA